MLHLQKQNSIHLLAFCEFWERLSYFGLLTIIVLYLTNVFLFSDERSYTVYGIYLALSFSFPVIGGMIADRLLGCKNAILLGGLLLIIGNSLLFIQQIYFLYMGMALCIVGAGLYKTSSTTLVGKFYVSNAGEHGSGFTVFYAVMNAGAVAGPVVYGIIAHFLGWHYGFLLGAVGILIALLTQTFLLKSNDVDPPKKNIYSAFMLTLCCLIGLSFAVILLFLHPQLFERFLYCFGILVLLFIIFIAFKKTAQERRHIFGLILLNCFCIFFFAASLQVGSSLSLFINRDINRVVFGWQIPTTLFSALDPFFVVLAAPLLTMLWNFLRARQREPYSSTKLSIGLLMACLSFLCFYGSATVSLSEATGHFDTVLIVLGYFLLGSGEMCLTPSILTAISQYCPNDIQGMIMGSWFLSIAFAGYFGSLLAKFSDHQSGISVTKVQSIQIFQHSFLATAAITLAASISLFFLTPLIKKIFRH
ncbi:MAG: hypothetical protein A2103_04930 [Gammaproteobacteria bacterium GWF2_41_13]|nr:MAG: hypothetical protein A2103_04930 [Gammaproteobacteria bacterium GWF2_41_13]